MDKQTRELQREVNRRRSLCLSLLESQAVENRIRELDRCATPVSKIPAPDYDPRDVAFKPVKRDTKMLSDMQEEMDDLLQVYTSGEEHLKYKERAALDSLTYCMKRYIEAQEERKTMSDKLRNFKEKLEAVENNDYDDEEEAEGDDD